MKVLSIVELQYASRHKLQFRITYSTIDLLRHPNVKTHMYASMLKLIYFISISTSIYCTVQYLY